MEEEELVGVIAVTYNAATVCTLNINCVKLQPLCCRSPLNERLYADAIRHSYVLSSHNRSPAKWNSILTRRYRHADILDEEGGDLYLFISIEIIRLSVFLQIVFIPEGSAERPPRLVRIHEGEPAEVVKNFFLNSRQMEVTISEGDGGPSTKTPEGGVQSDQSPQILHK